ncbi:MAG: thiamine pyrophosphate-binding protein, partial [Candidatus Methanomethyliaceae archaeon]|nr:thiamine pyrophosphate-binding protein [Candidatus Methanomethyliaceae archaeon]
MNIAFGMPGMWSLPIYEALSNSKIKHILMRNEQFAAYASDGFTRASGRIGLCIGSAGQGAVNLAAGLAASFKDNSSIISIISQVPTYEQGKGWIEDVNLTAIFSQVTKFCTQINDPYEAYNMVCRAYLSCLEGCPGPSCIIIPGDIQKKPSIMLNYSPTPSKIIPNSESIELVLREIFNSKFPLILAGRGAVFSNASDLMLRFIETTEIPLVTSMMGRGIVPESHPLCLGPVGRRGFKEANEALLSCDLLLVLGCRLSNMTIGKMDLKCKIIQVDIEAKNFSPISNIKIKGDVSAFLELIIKKLSKIKSKPISKDIDDVIPYAKEIAKSKDAIFTLDIGQNTIWLLKALRIEHPRQLVFSGGMSSMGFSIPAAIGAKFALPNRKVIAVVGDGGFQMSSSELST